MAERRNYPQTLRVLLTTPRLLVALALLTTAVATAQLMLSPGWADAASGAAGIVWVAYVARTFPP